MSGIKNKKMGKNEFRVLQYAIRYSLNSSEEAQAATAAAITTAMYTMTILQMRFIASELMGRDDDVMTAGGGGLWEVLLKKLLIGIAQDFSHKEAADWGMTLLRDRFDKNYAWCGEMDGLVTTCEFDDYCYCREEKLTKN